MGTYLLKYLLLEVMYMECRGHYNVIGGSGASVELGGAYRSMALYAGIRF